MDVSHPAIVSHAMKMLIVPQPNYISQLHQLLEATIAPDTNVIKQVSHRCLWDMNSYLTPCRQQALSIPNSTNARNVFRVCTKFLARAQIPPSVN